MKLALATMIMVSAFSASFAPANAQQPSNPPQDGSNPSTNSARDVSHYNIQKGKPAIEGYDPVAYFPEGGGKPAKGKKELSSEYRGVRYSFASEANRTLFTSNPEKYEPAYGGWCATAMADGGRKIEISPKNYKITNGRLFLFYKDIFSDALDFWNKDEGKHTKTADDAWMTLTGEAPRAGG